MMAPTATALDTTRASQLFHALSDETRLDVIQRLMDGERCVCELTDVIDASQSRLSFHLKTLKDADLVTDRREGRWVYYTLNRDTLEEMGDLIGALAKEPRRFGNRKGAACCD
jgi:ArsR family transcriptional regulator